MKNKQIVWLLAITIIPIAMSFVFYLNPMRWKLSTTNLGHLVKPEIQVQGLWVQDTPQKKWQILYAPTQCCDKQCLEMMHTLHQIRIATGKDHTRVNLVLLAKNTCLIESVHDFEKIIFNAPSLQKLHRQLPSGDQIYFVDPIGNLFMSYPATTNPMNILKDLKHVLEVSQIG